MILTGNLQLDINVSKRDEVEEAIKLLESLVLSPRSPQAIADQKALDVFEASRPEPTIPTKEEIEQERRRLKQLDEAAEELDNHDGNHFDKDVSNVPYKLDNDFRLKSRVLEKLPPKILNRKLEEFRTLFELALGANNEISIYRLSKPLLKKNLVQNNIQARELIRMAKSHNLIKETRPEVYARIA